MLKTKSTEVPGSIVTNAQKRDIKCKSIKESQV